jgi:hypothetical protein
MYFQDKGTFCEFHPVVYLHHAQSIEFRNGALVALRIN